MNNIEIFIMILVASIATVITRFLPFIIFNKKEKTSKTLLVFEKAMPLMIMVILVFYTIKDIEFFKVPFGVAEILAILFTIFLHLKFKSVLISIIASTIFYMILVQIVLPKIM